MSCSTCYSTGDIDCWGRVIPCPDCYVELDAAWRYHPRSVTIESSPDYRPELFNARYIVLDASTGPRRAYGAGRTWEEAVRVQRRRQGVIKAALTRRANKAAREAAQA